MAEAVKLPRLGQGMESGTIVKWLKAEGDEVAKGEPLYELDTDKVTQEVEAEVAGVLLKIAVAEGEVPVGETIAVIGEQGEDVPTIATESRPAQPVDAPQPEREAPVSEQVTQVREPSGNGAGARIKASPLARRIARERGIELGSLKGTGPEGRVVAEDVERAATGAPTPVTAVPVASGEVERQELTSVRRTIARRLTEAWQAPAFQIAMSAGMAPAPGMH